MEADRDGVDADAQHDRDLRMAQTLPRHEAQQLLVIRPQSTESDHCRTFGPRREWCRDVLRLRADPLQEARPAFARTALVGQDATSDRVQPGQRCIGSVLVSPPRDDERLGGCVLGVREARSPAEGIGHDRTLVSLVEVVEVAATSVRIRM